MSFPTPPSQPAPSDSHPEAFNPELHPGGLPPVYRPKVLLPVLLFLLTLVSTVISGVRYHTGFLLGGGAGDSSMYPHAINFLAGLPYALAILGILLAHELGHYLACRYYGIAATLPYFIPLPLVSIAGTMGAFIRIRSAFGNRRELFDVGVAGPLAGYAFALPALIIGIKASQVIPMPALEPGDIWFGEPLIFKIVAHLFFDYSEATETLNLHPIGWAAWFGIFATSINLFPAGQLDGGHITYALFGARLHRKISIGVCLGLLALSAATWSPAYLVFAALVLILGLGHPRTLLESQPLDAARVWVAWLAGLILVLSFVPVPFRLL